MMQAVILAGGFGTRLRPLTYTRPKPLMPIMNKPMIMHIIDNLPNEVNEVLLAVNYKKEMIEKYFNKNVSRIEVKLIEEKEPLGTGGAIKNLEKYINGSFLAFNGDVITSLDISEFLKFHRKKSGLGTLALRKVDDPTAYGIIGIDNKNKIYKFLEKPKKEEVFSNLINAGTYILEPEIFDFIEPGKKVSIEKEVYPFVLDNNLFGYKIDGYWTDVGRLESYLEAHRILMDENLKNGKEKELGENLNGSMDLKIIPPVVVGNDCKIEGTIGPYCCIGNNVKINKGSVITNSVLFDNCFIDESVKISESIIGEYCNIVKKSSIKRMMIADKSNIEEKSILENTKKC